MEASSWKNGKSLKTNFRVPKGKGRYRIYCFILSHILKHGSQCLNDAECEHFQSPGINAIEVCLPKALQKSPEDSQKKIPPKSFKFTMKTGQKI